MLIIKRMDIQVYLYNVKPHSNKKKLLIPLRTWMILRKILPVKELLHKTMYILYDSSTYMNL